MGRKSRGKGYRGEYNLVQVFRKENLSAIRVPLSGATDFAKGDVVVEGMVGEVKMRRNGFKELYKWLANKDLLFLKADREDYLCVMPISKFMQLMKGVKKR